MDTSGLEALPEVQAQMAELAVHRGLLERQHAALATVMMAVVDEEVPIELPSAERYSDLEFLGKEPLVQTRTIKEGAGLFVILTTDAFALETARSEDIFTGRHAVGDISEKGVFDDRGRNRCVCTTSA